MARPKKYDSPSKYINAFMKEAYDRISVTVPKGTKEDIAKAAKAQGISTNEYIRQAIAAKMEGTP